MRQPDELQVVLTPLQLAAILSNGTLEQPSFANRAWGVAGAIVGAIEVVGGGAMFVMPDRPLLPRSAAARWRCTASTRFSQTHGRSGPG